MIWIHPSPYAQFLFQLTSLPGKLNPVFEFCEVIVFRCHLFKDPDIKRRPASAVRIHFLWGGYISLFAQQPFEPFDGLFDVRTYGLNG
jgi:hypothetical protein